MNCFNEAPVIIALTDRHKKKYWRFSIVRLSARKLSVIGCVTVHRLLCGENIVRRLTIERPLYFVHYTLQTTAQKSINLTRHVICSHAIRRNPIVV